MEDITEITLRAIKRYMKSLASFGFRGEVIMNQIIILTFLEEQLTSDFRTFLIEDHYKIISKGLESILGTSVIIPYNPIYTKDSIQTESILKYFKSGEVYSYNALRPTEDNHLRLVE